MKIQTRVLSTLLAVLLMLGSLTVLGIFSVGADLSTSEKEVAEKYLKHNVYKTPEDKLASMTLMQEKYGYQMYVDSLSGEIAMREIASGAILFSNPYDVASSKGSDSIKTSGTPGTKEQLLLSQVIIQYVDNGTTKYLYSFQDAAMRHQIDVSRIKSGVRVEYTIGKEEFRKLVPRWIPVDVFDELIRKPLIKAIEGGAMNGIPAGDGKTAEDNFQYKKFMSFYALKDPSKEDTAGAIEAMHKAYPITKEMPIYVFATDASAVEINERESTIKTYCEDYTFEQMDADHETTGYEATDDEYPVFKLALEYSLDEDGLSVRVPCNGLQYNTSSYTLENLSILPYMGAGNTKNEGYNFYPDGAGSLFDYNLNKTNTIRGKIYGVDYAYHQISGTYQKAIRVSVYGSVATEVIYSYGYTQTKTDDEGNVTVTEYPNERVSNTVMTREQLEEFLAGDGITVTKPITESSYKRGYVAVIESGESLGEIETYFAGALSDYATMSNYFNPKPKDSYDIADSISVTSSSTWTVVSNRKYTGNIRIHYQLLCDEKIGEAKKAEDSSYTYYDASWLGMAEAYRNYLVKNGTLTKLTEEDVEEDIPLYMEVFGALETQQTIATIPVNVMTPLTSFENILTMYNELKDQQVKNINFKMTGFANGGMYATVPSSLKWEKAVGGKSGFEDLVAEAGKINAAEDANHIGLYPDFDFAYSSQNSLFDALSLKKDAVRTIDNRYTSKRQYSATQQKYVSFYELAISPSRYSKFYEKLMKNYSAYGLDTMSVGSLGTALNSDFDEDNPYNREDGKEFTVKAFEDLTAAKYKLMTDGGNAYTWGFVDHIINMDLDSSRYVKASSSIPFLGAVLHGYVQFAGTPLNEEGDTDYAMLKAIENGAGMYFILSYQNTQELKEDEVLSQYYSIRYDIWRDDVVGYYSELNGLLKDVQTKVIVDHRFLNYNNTDIAGNAYLTERVLDPDELLQDMEEEIKKAEEQAREDEKNEAINAIASVAEARIAIQKSKATLAAMYEEILALNETLEGNNEGSFGFVDAKLQDFEIAGLSQDTVDGVRNALISLWTVTSKIEYQFAQMDQLIVDLEEILKLVEDKTAGTSSAYQFADATEQLNAAKTALAAYKTEQQNKYNTLTADRTLDEYVTDQINAVAQKVNIFNGTDPAPVTPLVFDLTLDMVKEEGKYEPEEKGESSTDTEASYEDTKYHVNNNTVVSVTYGDVDAATGNKTAYKTFLLNYNNFAVKVTYGGVIYTVEANGYVVVPAQN